MAIESVPIRDQWESGGESIFNGKFLIDAHVHLYPSHPVTEFLDGALTNFLSEAARRGLDRRGPFLLLFAATPREQALPRLRRFAEVGGHEGWNLHATAELGSLIARRDTGASLVLIDGRQIITREGIEVLALVCCDDLPGNLPLRETVEAVRDLDALAVIPWSFGKWWLDRGKAVRRLLESDLAKSVHVGDNAGRPRGTPPPRLLNLASRRGVYTLPGTDPLPFAGDSRRAGSYGFVLEGRLNLWHPAQDMKSLIRALEAQPAIYGSRDRLERFLLRQARLRIPGPD